MQSVTYRLSGSNRSLELVALLCFALFLYPLLMTVGTGLRLLEVPGTEWIKSYGVAEDIGLFWGYFLMTVTMGLLFAVMLRGKSPARNHLALDDVGLTYTYLGRRRTWPWRDIEAAEVAVRWPGIQVGKLSIAGRFGWAARIGLIFMNGLASAKRLTVTLPDLYEPPIEDVVAGINACRDRALGIKRPAGDAAQPSPLMQTVAAGETITFAMPKSVLRYQRIITFAPLMIIAVAVILFLLDGTPWSALWSGQWSLVRPSDLNAPVSIVVLLVLAFLSVRQIRQDNNSLRLDPAGLTYRREGRRYAWPWTEVSAFTHHKLAGSNLAGRRQVITFAAPGRDWMWRWIRRLYRLPKAPPAVVIDGVYDTPLTEIAALLNAYRDRALGRRDAADGPQQPEPT